jgi:GxxExxY protein
MGEDDHRWEFRDMNQLRLPGLSNFTSFCFAVKTKHFVRSFGAVLTARRERRSEAKKKGRLCMADIILKDLSVKVLGLAFEVHNQIGCGLLESAYEEGMVWELKHAGFRFERQKMFELNYKGDFIGGYFADLVVEDSIILELKAVKQLNKVMEAQLLNYLKLSGLPVGYLINFAGLRVEWKRFVLSG